ncbi:glycoside hydrolase family 3 N-terminal domain-containing protein [Aurantibacillus circumpalustris]|uniref:glycoside hydrolase family 3 N-terminal domain-containing protein n=1 Tax=Aurantibacillus circumpalustris TaxID=3036359 RepID=UPI00295BCE6F|nr:glycoside hydrolase family 3 N-terminal domain-containing protein [Aurantibacillus circumpalustris]
MKRFYRTTFVLLLFALVSFNYPPKKKTDPDFIAIQNRWVDSVFNSLSPKERLAQLFMVAAYSNKDAKHAKEIKDLITNYKIGGLIWMQGGPVRQGKLANYYQSISKTPLLYSIDGEWGLAMRLDSTPRYPKQMTLGAIQNDSLIYQMGRQIARECKRMGIHVNFAPVADVNNNPLNPVIGMRSFGENKYNVAQKAYMYMQGLQDEHVMANGKHFPGHGDTDSDSHKTLPYINHSRERLDTLELYPFQYLFDKGLASVMVAHLNIPSLDTTKDLASTLSPNVVNDLLKTKMAYKGLIFTDALNMKGVAKFYVPGEVDVKALLAGNDVLLFSGDVGKAMDEIALVIKDGKITQEEIDERCKKILKAKYWCGLNNTQEIVTRNLAKELNTKQSDDLNDKLAEASITLLKNTNNFLPLKGTDSLRILEVSIGVEEQNTLGNTLKNYAYVEHLGLSHDAKPSIIALALERIKESDIVVLQVNKATLKAENNYGVGDQTLKLIDSISKIKPTILVMMTNPYLLNKISSIANFKAVMVAYEYLPSLLRASANAIMGNIRVNGKLPVSTNHFKSGTGLVMESSIKNENVRREIFMNKKFGAVDSIALSGIREKAYPGCEIVALKDGQIIYQKSFGKFTYSPDSKAVDNGTLYDLASLTKIAASSLALMKLRSEGNFDYTKTLGSYLPYLKDTDKENIIIEDVLSHQAGLQAWIPFYLRTIQKDGDYKPGVYSKTKSEDYPTEVAKNLYVFKGFNDSIYNRVIKSKVQNPGKYLYSDIGYYFMQQIIEQQSQKKLNEYVADIYTKVGIGLTYLPLKYFSKTQIAPTENDEKFRKQIIQGYVHDPGAALLGGVAGHAGLFGNALDVAKLMQLYLNKGELNGVRVLDSNVVKEFTTCRFCPGNRRGLCFEKPEADTKKDSPVVQECSLDSYGHSGFTGTFAWADPKNNLVVVFLSNRVYPNADENKLAKMGIRGNIHKAFYDALKK